MIWLNTTRRCLLDDVTISGVTKYTFGRRGSSRVDAPRDCLSCESVKSARLVSWSERATASASTLVVRRTLVGVVSDDSKQAAGHTQCCKSHSALQQRVVGCTAWFAQRKEMEKGKEGFD